MKGGAVKAVAIPPHDVSMLLGKDTLTSQEAADILGLSIMQISREFREGKLRGWRKTDAKNAAMIITTESVIEFAAKRQGRNLLPSNSKKASKRG